jgi:two-component system, cell cycle sensor histidine kinase and response regulator CckA
MLNETKHLTQKLAELEAENERLKRSLQQSEESFRKIFHASSNMMAIHTIDGRRFVDLNEAAASFGGFKREELIGHTMEARGLYADPFSVEMVNRKLKEEGRAHNVEMKLRTKTGGYHTVLASLDPITIDNEPCLLAVSVDITEREEKTDGLRRSEEKYRALVENSLQGLAIFQDSSIVFCNSMFAAMFGYSPDEILSLSPDAIDSMSHSDDLAALQARYRDQLSGNPLSPRFDYRGIKKDGTIIRVEAYTSVIEFGGKPAVQSVLMDITERKNAENALRESEERFRLIAENIDEIFYIVDLGIICPAYLSPAYERIWGYPRMYALENPDACMQFIHPDDRERVKTQVKLLNEGKPIDYEYRIIRSDGSIRSIWERGFPIVDENGDVKRSVGVGQDITEMRLTEEALKDSKEYLNQIINCIGDPIFVKNRDHRYVLVNDAFCVFTGLSRESLTRLVDKPKSAMPFWKEEEDVFITGKEILSENIFSDVQGASRTVMTRKFLLIDKNGNKQVVGVLRDITEYKRLESQFLQSQKMEAIGALAGGVAHDFNNLLNVINGYAELMLEEASPEDPMRKDLEQIKVAGQRATALTSQLLAFSRKQILQPEVLDLNHVIDDMSLMLRRMIGEDIDLVFNPDPDPIMVNADPGKIQQVVMNLVVNARDAMPNGGMLTIETAKVIFDESYISDHPMTKPGPFAMLAISDNGVGMDAATQARVFEPFFTTKEKGKGTGLGLSTVYGIVKQSDGFVWVYSEPGKGTTVKIYFPRVTSSITEAAPENKLGSELGGSETVLVVEDEEAVRALACRVLRNCGHNVLEAADGMEAIRIAEQYEMKIHLVISDVVMPGMGGRALVTRLEEMRPGIKALFVSGYTDNAIVHHGILDSDIAFLQKPFTIDALIRKVREVLGGG